MPRETKVRMCFRTAFFSPLQLFMPLALTRYQGCWRVFASLSASFIEQKCQGSYPINFYRPCNAAGSIFLRPGLLPGSGEDRQVSQLGVLWIPPPNEATPYHNDAFASFAFTILAIVECAVSLIAQ